MKIFDHIGIQIPTVYLPADGIDLTKWAVIACDQFTSEPEYWDQVDQIVGDNPSTLNLVLPEIYLGTPEEAARIKLVKAHMKEYLASSLLRPFDGIFYLERQFGNRLRKGILLCLDLEKYDFLRNAQSLIRATEGTIIERLPPRIKIRKHAALEIPHTIVLIDDPQKTVIEPLQSLAAFGKGQLIKRYDFDLMLGSGHLKGYQVVDPLVENNLIQALEALANLDTFKQKYEISSDQNVFLFAMGDGNHSMATAKSVWEKLKPRVRMDHPARFALVEVENIFDEGLELEPIHRVLFNLKKDVQKQMQLFFGQDLRISRADTLTAMKDAVDRWNGRSQVIGLISEDGMGTLELFNPNSSLPVRTLQNFLDSFMKDDGAEKIDYVHGLEAVSRLGREPGNVGFYLPVLDKRDLFKTVILDGALPRKSFSMGEAEEKRFYMESRKIVR